MKDIKFRAWDTITNKMHTSIEELCFENGILIEVIFKKSWDGIDSCADEVVDWQNADQTILMQYTGLKDKNGAEIYEGDIIIKPANKNRHLEVVFSTDISCFEAIHSVGARSLSGYVNSDGGVLIIGNRWDSPELLESHT